MAGGGPRTPHRAAGSGEYPLRQRHRYPRRRPVAHDRPQAQGITGPISSGGEHKQMQYTICFTRNQLEDCYLPTSLK
eukprot:101243-Pyramimonas_sp.AAC.1